MKRVHRIAEGVAALPDTVAVHWHHFGEGLCSDAVKTLATKLFANRSNIRCTFHGYVQNTQLPQVYQQIGAELFITTSETEGLPVSMMEAYAMGIPVIATGVGGIPEMVQDGDNGYLLPADASAAQVAEAIERFAALTVEQKAHMHQSARDRWQKDYNAAENAEKLMGLLEAL
jgi:glycosyltransferase involved in cell wall biosynthesis